jgi:hypothetical protein
MGFARGPPGGVARLSTVQLGRPTDLYFAKLARAAEWAIDTLRTEPAPLAIYIEKPISPKFRSLKTERILAGYVDAIGALAAYRGIPVHLADARTIRKWVLGDGALKSATAKALAMRAARAEGMDPQNDNEADAWAGWYWACGLYPGGPAPPMHLWNLAA